MAVIEYLSEENEHLVVQLLITLVQGSPELYVKSFDNYKDSEKRLQKFQSFAHKISSHITINSGNYLVYLCQAL